MEKDVDQLLTKQDASRILGISTKTLDRERSRRKLGFVMVGGSVRFRRADLRAYIESGSQPPEAG